MPAFLAENNDSHLDQLTMRSRISQRHFPFSRFFGLLSLFLLLSAHQIEVQASQFDEKVMPNPSSLLAGIDKANRSSSFRGLLTYEANGYINTIRLVQTVTDKTISQYLKFLDGPKRQVLRQKILSDCNKNLPKWQLWPRNIELEKLSKVYDIAANGVERVADREAYIINVTPHDDHRYGYRFSIDSETGLLLKTLFIINKKVIERLQFVELLLHAEGGSDLTDIVDAETSDQPLTVSTSQPCKSNKSNSDWNATWLPKGFFSVGNRLTDHGEQALIFSDGLATLSIFIIDKYKFIAKATARYGATAAVIAPLNGTEKKYMVIVVGEVPVATAQQVAASVRAQ